MDRFDRRRVLVLAEAGRALAAASVAVALGLHHLTLVHLLAVAVVLGGSGSFSGTARILLVRAVVPSDQLTAALTQEQVRDGASQLAGPPLGGLLYGIRQPPPFLFSAVAFAVSLICALVVRVPVDAGPRRTRHADRRCRAYSATRRELRTARWPGEPQWRHDGGE